MKENFNDQKVLQQRRYRRRKRRKETQRNISPFLVNIFLFIFWHWLKKEGFLVLSFVTSDFFKLLPFLNLVLWFNIWTNFLVLFNLKEKIYRWFKIINFFLNSLFFYRLYSLFPFDLSKSLLAELCLKILLVIIAIVFGVSAILEFLEILFLSKPKKSLAKKLDKQKNKIHT